jgi:hypothetical protein
MVTKLVGAGAVVEVLAVVAVVAVLAVDEVDAVVVVVLSSSLSLHWLINNTNTDKTEILNTCFSFIILVV